MEKRTSIIESLRHYCRGYLNPKLIDVFLVEENEANNLEYIIEESFECTITYRHNLGLWSKTRQVSTPEKISGMEFGKDEFDIVTFLGPGESLTVNNFIARFIIEDHSDLAMMTKLFSDNWRTE